MTLNYHDVTDRRLLELTRACVEKFDHEIKTYGLAAKPSAATYGPLMTQVEAMIGRYPEPHRRQWQRLWALPWHELKAVLLAETEAGNELRQNIPFGGVLTPEERQAILDAYKRQFPPIPRPSAADLAAYPQVDRKPVRYA